MKQVGQVSVGCVDIGATEPNLVSYRFVASATTKTATVRLYNSDGVVIAEKTLTITTTAKGANDSSNIFGSAWSDAWVGMEVVTADATVYALASDTTPSVEVTASNGKALAAGMWLGMVPQRVRDAYAETVAGGATAAKQDTGNTSLASIDTKLSTLDGRVDGLETLLAGGLPAALGSNGGLKVQKPSNDSIYRNIDLGVTGQVVKASAGVITGWSIVSIAGTAAARYVKIYNKATAADENDTPIMTLEIWQRTRSDQNSLRLAFATGISIRATTGVADNDTGAPATNDVQVNFFYE